MSKEQPPPAYPEPLAFLKTFTNARIALGRVGISQPIQAHLDFQLAHALARDTVTMPLDFSGLGEQLTARGYSTLLLQTLVENHPTYLQRPDKGRLLNALSIERLKTAADQQSQPDIALIVADGLSSKAIENHAVPLLEILIAELQATSYSFTPICLVQYGRVAIGDPIGERLNAGISVVLIGERPGLSSPDSLGIYFTYQPKSGRTDAERNCISNIHGNGLNYQDAVHKLLFLIHQARRLKMSGVNLKDTTASDKAVNQRRLKAGWL